MELAGEFRLTMGRGRTLRTRGLPFVTYSVSGENRLLRTVAVISNASYACETYGRFPAYPAPFRTSVGFQAAHLDLGFYEKFYRPEALGDAHRSHDAVWHPR